MSEDGKLIAEWCGWSQEVITFDEDDAIPSIGIYPGSNVVWKSPQNSYSRTGPIDCTTSLDAFHTLEHILVKRDPMLYGEYRDELKRVVEEDWLGGKFFCGFAVSASLSQRVRAFKTAILRL